MKNYHILLFIGMFLHSAAQAQQPMTPTILFRTVSRSVVVVEALDINDSVIGIGSGVVVGTPNQVITNRHVIDGGTKWRVRQGDVTSNAQIMYIDPDHDLGVLRADSLSAPTVSLRLSTPLAVGERVFAIGSPRGLELTLTEGLISGIRDYEGGHILQTSVALSPGSSGGGLFDQQGRLVGITSFGLTESQNLNFALPVEWVQFVQSNAHHDKVAAQRQSADASDRAFLRAETALSNLETFVWDRRSLKDRAYRPPQRHFGVSEFLLHGVLECLSYKESPDCPDNWPLWLRASLKMLQLRQEIRSAQPSRDELEKTFLNAAISAWSSLADMYCEDRPGGSYTDLQEKAQLCGSAPGLSPLSDR